MTRARPGARWRLQRRRRGRPVRRPGPRLAIGRARSRGGGALRRRGLRCGARRGGRVAEAAEGASVLDAALIGPEEISAELGGLSPPGHHAAELAADALHRALGAAASGGERLLDPPVGGDRVLVAVSGGVDSAVAALLERRHGAEVVAVTLKLWADRHTDGARSCCSPEAVVVPGARPRTGVAAPDARPRGGVSRHRRAGVPSRKRGGRTRTRAWSATGRCG